MKLLEKILFCFIRLIPRQPNSKFQRFLAFLLNRVLKYRSKVISKNLRLCFPDNMELNDEIKHNYYKNLSRYITETLRAMVFKEEELLKKVSLEYTSEASQLKVQHEIQVILGSHLGNWELISMAMPHLLNMEVVVVYKPLSNKWLNGVLNRSRSRFGLKLAPMGEIARHMISRPPNTCFYFVTDQSPPAKKEGEVATFFNMETVFYDGVLKLAKKYKCQVYYLHTTIGEDHYRISLEGIDANNITQEYANKLERDIREKPSYWLWSHNRWKHKMPLHNSAKEKDNKAKET